MATAAEPPESLYGFSLPPTQAPGAPAAADGGGVDAADALKAAEALLAQLERVPDVPPSTVTTVHVCASLLRRLQVVGAARGHSDLVRASCGALCATLDQTRELAGRAGPRAAKQVERLNALLHTQVEHAKELLDADDQLQQPPPSSSEEGFRAADVLENADAAAFWLRRFGPAVHMVSWRKFVDALHADLGYALSADRQNYLRSILDSALCGAVSAHRLQEFVAGFGGTVAEAVQQLSATMSQGWFHSFTSSEEAEAILYSRPPGTFLVRCSASRACAFAVSVVGDDHAVQHALVNASTSRGFQLDGTWYTSLADLVSANAGSLRFPAPNGLSRSGCFHGFLTYPETVELLRGKRAGTFLFRFSRSNPGSLVVAFVNARGKVQQSLLHANPDSGGYTLAENTYATLEDVVRAHRTKLVFPCATSSIPGRPDPVPPSPVPAPAPGPAAASPAATGGGPPAGAGAGAGAADTYNFEPLAFTPRPRGKSAAAEAEPAPQPELEPEQPVKPPPTVANMPALNGADYDAMPARLARPTAAAAAAAAPAPAPERELPRYLSQQQSFVVDVERAPQAELYGTFNPGAAPSAPSARGDAAAAAPAPEAATPELQAQPEPEPDAPSPSPSPTQSRERADSRGCPVCLDRERAVVLTPCGHTLCAECSVALRKRLCPICRRGFVSTTRFYL